MFEKAQLVSDAAHMAEFSHSQAYDVMKAYLERQIKAETDRLVTGTNLFEAEMRRIQGVVEGLRWAIQVPGMVQNLARQQSR